MRKNIIAKVTATVMMVTCMAAMTACGNDQSTSSQAGVTAADAAATQQSGGYTFEAKNVAMTIDGKVEDYKAKLGEPAGGYYEAKSCAFDGMDKFYYYDGFTLQAYQKNNEDVVYSLLLLDDTVKTKEGVKIGDNKDKMVSAYGSSYKEGSGQFTYTSGNTNLIFTVNNDVIEGIEYVLAN